MDIPDPAEYSGSSDFAEALADALRPIPLGGPKERVTKEIREWAEASGLGPEQEDLLDRYNEAATSAPKQVSATLLGLAEQEPGRKGLIGLLGVTGASDPVRLAALEALGAAAEASDAEDLARVNMRQRPAVLGKALEVLAATESATALFAMAKVFSARDDDAAEQASRLADGLWEKVPAGKVVRSASPPSSSFSSGGVSPEQLLQATLALDSAEQVQLAASSAGKNLLKAISATGVELDGRLREMADKGSTLPAYYVRLRNELLELALLTGTPDDPAIHKRAVDNLFKREDLDDVASVAIHLPQATLLEYAERALTKANRRGKRADRAAAALRLVSAHSAAARTALRETAIECMGEKDDQLRFEAARVLAVDSDSLDPGTRASLTEAFNKLPPQLQRRLAPELKGVGSGGAYVNLDGFLRWVDGASEEELPRRLDALLERWAEDGEVTPDDAEQLIQAFGGGYSRLAEVDRPRLREALAPVAADWLRSQGTRVVDPVRALLGWRGFQAIAVEQYPAIQARLRADQSRALLQEALGGQQVQAPLLAVAAGLVVGEEAESQRLMPVIRAAVSASPDAAGAAIEHANEQGVSRLLTAALLEARIAKAGVLDARTALESNTTEDLERHRRAVLDALHEAEDAAEGNARLAELFGEIRTAMGGARNSESAGERGAGELEGGDAETGRPANGADAPDTPSEAVVAWRAETAERLSDWVGAANGGEEPLGFSPASASDPNEVAELIGELDRRSHSKRVAPVADRPQYETDLGGLLEAVLRDELVTAGQGGEDLAPSKSTGDEASSVAVVEAISGGTPAARELFWTTWARRASANGGSAAGGEHGAGLAAASDEGVIRSAIEQAAAAPTEPDSISRLEASIAASNEDQIGAAVSSLKEDQVRAAWECASSLLEVQLRDLSQLRAREANREAKVGAEVGRELDLPFRVIEKLLFSYFRFREQLTVAGWRPVEERLGKVKRRSQINPDAHHVQEPDAADTSADEGEDDRFVVRSLGVKFKGKVVSKAVIEPLSGLSGEGSSDDLTGDEPRSASTEGESGLEQQ